MRCPHCGSSALTNKDSEPDTTCKMYLADDCAESGMQIVAGPCNLIHCDICKCDFAVMTQNVQEI